MKLLILFSIFTSRLEAQYIEVDFNTRDLTPLPIVKDHGRAPAKVDDPVFVQDENRSDVKDKYNRSPAIISDKYNYSDDESTENSRSK